MKNAIRPLAVFLDTSFILTMIKNHRMFNEEIRTAVAGPTRIIIPDSVLMELQRLARNGKFRVAGLAKVALEMFETKKIDTVETKPRILDVDVAILALALAERNPTAVATVDRTLRQLLSKHRLMTVFPRNRRGLIVS